MVLPFETMFLLLLISFSKKGIFGTESFFHFLVTNCRVELPYILRDVLEKFCCEIDLLYVDTRTIYFRDS